MERIAYYVEVIPGMNVSKAMATTYSVLVTAIILITTIIYLRISGKGLEVRRLNKHIWKNIGAKTVFILIIVTVLMAILIPVLYFFSLSMFFRKRNLSVSSATTPETFFLMSVWNISKISIKLICIMMILMIMSL